MADVVRSQIRLIGVGLVCAQVALIPLVFDYPADMPFPVTKALLGHGLAFATLGTLVALLLRFGRAALVWSPLHVPVLAYLAACTVATLFAKEPYLAVFGTHDRMLGLATIAQWVLLYFAVIAFVRTRGESVAVAASAFGASAAVLAYELIQVLGLDPYKWAIEGVERAFSTIGNPTTLGQYASTMAVVAFAVALLAPRLQQRARAVLLALAAALIWGTAATDSRAPIVGLGAAAVVLVVAIWWTRRGSRDARIALFAGAAAIAALAGLVVLTPIGTRIAFTLQATGSDDIFNRVDPSTAGRLALYGMAIGEFLERPLVGYGPENFVVGVGRYRQEAGPLATRASTASSVHSWILQTAATSGLLGLISLLAAFVVALVLVVRARFAPVPLIAATTLAAQLGTGLTTVDDVSTGWITWFCLGMIAAATGTAVPAAMAPAPATSGRRRRSARRAVAVEPSWKRGAVYAALVAGFVPILLATTALGASRSAKTSTDSRVAGNVPASIAAGLAATAADPGRAEYWHTLGLAYVGANRIPDALAPLQKANDLTPFLAGYTGDFIQVYLAMGQAGDAKAKTRAVELASDLVARDPNNPLAHYYRAQALGVAGDTAGALTAIERALALDPGSTNALLYRVAAQLYLLAGRAQDAVDIARKGITTIGQEKELRDLRDVLDRALAALGQAPAPRPDPDACTSTRWSATPAVSATAGTSVIFTVVAQGCQRQESRIAIQPPTATAPSYLNGGNWAAAFTWNTKDLPPGTYRIFVYTRRVGWTGPYQATYDADYVLR